MSAKTERDAWKETARQYAQNADYWKEQYETLAAVSRKVLRGVIEETRSFSEVCPCEMCEGIRALREMFA